MITVVQRISNGSVTIVSAEQPYISGRAERGLLLLTGFGKGDTRDDIDWSVKKIAALRIFGDEQGKMNRSVVDVGGTFLAVSQFTLTASIAGGNRPSFDACMEPESAKAMFDLFVERLKATGVPVETGVFGEHMMVALTNDGPVTILVNSQDRKK